MDYKKHYENLIKTRFNRILNPFIHYEKHHIIPRSFGGKRNKENLINLTYKEHFIAHKLLFEFCIGQEKVKMGYALHRLCFANNKNQKYRIKGAREYEKIKEGIYQFIRGENHPNFGKIMWDEEQRKNISERMLGSKNPQYGKHSWNYGLTKECNDILKKQGEILSQKFKKGEIHILNWGKQSDEGKKRIGNAQRNKPKTKECRNKISEKLKNRKLSEETKQKMRNNSQKGKKQKILTCPYCNKCGGTTMYRWHFKNCKFK
jgi:hypothetical protein